MPRYGEQERRRDLRSSKGPVGAHFGGLQRDESESESECSAPWRGMWARGLFGWIGVCLLPRLPSVLQRAAMSYVHECSG